GWLAFGYEKMDEVAVLARAYEEGPDTVADAFNAARTALATRPGDPRVHVAAVRERLARLGEADARRTPSDRRARAQAAALDLPTLPTTTIGSFPQTGEIRVARAALRSGEIDRDEYRRRMRAQIAETIALQERLGLDVLVHGEPERNDMVQY